MQKKRTESNRCNLFSGSSRSYTQQYDTAVVQPLNETIPNLHGTTVTISELVNVVEMRDHKKTR